MILHLKAQFFFSIFIFKLRNIEIKVYAINPCVPKTTETAKKHSSFSDFVKFFTFYLVNNISACLNVLKVLKKL